MSNDDVSAKKKFGLAHKAMRQWSGLGETRYARLLDMSLDNVRYIERHGNIVPLTELQRVYGVLLYWKSQTTSAAEYDIFKKQLNHYMRELVSLWKDANVKKIGPTALR
jgi:hypothetical protein